MKPKAFDTPGCGTGYFAEYRCIPCGNGSWCELPTTVSFATPRCCDKHTVPTGRIWNYGALVSIVAKHKAAA